MAPIPNITFLTSFLTKRTILSSEHQSARLRHEAVRNLPRMIHHLHPGDGVTSPDSIPNLLVFIVFGLIGAGLVTTLVWFFFRAKNGGFQFKETDWDDYKSSVMGRKARSHTKTSVATSSTDLGGQSIYNEENSIKHKQSKKGSSPKSKRGDEKRNRKNIKVDVVANQVLETSDVSDLKGEKQERQNTRTINIAADIIHEEANTIAIDDLTAYRHEKSARVGGLNTESEASVFVGPTNASFTTASVVASPNRSPSKMAKYWTNSQVSSIRKVVSVSEGHSNSQVSTDKRRHRSKKSYLNEDGELVKIRDKRLQEEERVAQRREFSFRTGDDRSNISTRCDTATREEHKNKHRSSKRKLTQKTIDSLNDENQPNREVVGDVGTKSYHHPIPELSSNISSSDYMEERRRRRNDRKA